VFTGKSVKQVTVHTAEAVGGLNRPLAIVGHSFGGPITRQPAGRGLAAVSVPMGSAPRRYRCPRSRQTQQPCR